MISVRESTKTASPSGIDRHPSSESGGSGGGNDWHPERNGGSNSDYDSPVDKYKVAVWVVLAGVSMMFTALTSAYVVRALTDVGNNGWVPISVPGMLWVSSTLIVASSITLTLAGRELVRGRDRRFSRFLWL